MERNQGEGSTLQRACVCGSVEYERMSKRARVCKRKERESDRETETDVPFGKAVSSSTSVSDACAARCRKSGSERRAERRREK